MLAHGRVAGQVPEPPFGLFKFGKEENGYVKVTHKALLDRELFKAKIDFTYRQLQQVVKASQGHGQDITNEA